MKTKDILFVHNLLKEQGKTLSKVESDDAKFDIIILVSKMRKIAEDYQELIDDAMEKLKGENHDEMQELLISARRDSESITKEQYAAINKYYKEYQERVDKCVEPETNKDHELDITCLKDNLKGVILSYGWDMPTADSYIKAIES